MSSILPDQRPQRSAKNSTKNSAIKWVVVAGLALFIAVSALPRYFSSWPWATPPQLPHQSALQAIRDQGISLPGWVTLEQVKDKLGGKTWSIQKLSPAADDGGLATPEKGAHDVAVSSSVFLLLRPQIWEADQPEVEWLDIKGSQHWTTDSRQKISFGVPANYSEKSKTVRISSDFFRAWNQGQTYAVLQWYAWPTGGSASPARWFWADQKAQWSRYERMPWVAVSIWLPIAPLSDITPHLADLESLGKTLQQALLQSVFTSASVEMPTGRLSGSGPRA